MCDSPRLENNPVHQPHLCPVISRNWPHVRKAFYNPATKQILGRTLANWGRLLVFYFIFYGVLGGLIAACVYGLISTLNDKEPKWKLQESLIGTNPGLGFRPFSLEDGALIAYNDKQPGKWIQLLDEFLEPYERHGKQKNVMKCDYQKKAKSNFVCWVDTKNFGPCGKDYKYGYNTSSPCVFIKLNKIFGWVPETYTKPQEGMPPDLVKYIKNLPKTQKNQIWVSCKGENSTDRENVREFFYYPSMGFPAYYYPYMNIENYLSPIIAVHITDPTPNFLVNIECRAWAENIYYKGSKEDRQGSVHFEILYKENNN